ncbi:hypothetical protein E4T44_03926 [Aureobasidium sp. EXF-8845]|nr:hypothetical protein E4T44_03926 [Aureobasidium sp. EXF-8845]KAI4854696.1 hypothetical protein E4T45_03879 [Aureobasidium sp. EXF-8846]
MAAMVGKYAANKMLRGQMAKYQSKQPCGDQDPFFVYIDDPRKPGKQKKVKKTVPSYIPEHDANVLAKMRRRSYRMDMALFEFLGTRFGWSSVIGIVPAAGDAIDAAIALLLVRGCMKVKGGLPMGILIQMLINVAIDFFIGLIPFLGDIADAYFKANTKNCRLLEEHLDTLYKPDNLRAVKDRSGKRNPPATAFEDFSDEEDDRRAFLQETRPHTDGAHEVRQPAPSADPRAKKSGGWFNFGGNTRPAQDLESGANAGRATRVDNSMETGTLRNDRR